MRCAALAAALFLMTACTPATATPVPAVPPTAMGPTAVSQPTRPAPISTPTATLVNPTRPAQSSPVDQRPSFGIDIEPMVLGFKQPLYLTHAGDDSGRLFVVEQAGRIWTIQDGQRLDKPFLDIVSLVDSSGNEQGLLSVAFSPDYKSNGAFFVNYTRQPDGATVIARYTVSTDPGVADANSAAKILVVNQPERNHNGGLVLFGPNGYLYIGMGDGGGAGDQHGSLGNGQDPTALLGKMLRIDVNADTSSIPDSNPFANGKNARPEIWAIGLRNPWRFSFDRATGDLYIADVGQNVYEEIDFQPASSRGGENYGWRIMEGLHCFNPGENCNQTGLVLPIAEYDHGSGCSVTGGFVYRGAKYPWLDGVYFFADYCFGTIWSLERDASGRWNMTERLQPDIRVSSFGEDESGELYVIGYDDGTVYRLTSTSP